MICAGVAFAMFGNPEKINLDLTQGAVLLWLGIGASGLGYFLWNKGACEVDSGTLAIMNNTLMNTENITTIIHTNTATNTIMIIVAIVPVTIIMKFLGNAGFLRLVCLY